MGQIPGTWREQRLIESFDVDVRGRLRPQHMFAYLLNSAWNHTKGTDFGFNELSERNLMWVLIRSQILIERSPEWGEEIQIETWAKRTEKFYALRDFSIKSSTGEKLVSATSSWMILDKTSGRPQRFDHKTLNFPWVDKNEMETSLGKVPELTNGQQTAQYRVLYSDIDINKHVNSARYLQWIIDSHSCDFLKESEARSIEISFLSSASQDDKISVLSQKTEAGESYSVRRVSDDRELCRAKIFWSR